MIVHSFSELSLRKRRTLVALFGLVLSCCARNLGESKASIFKPRRWPCGISLSLSLSPFSFPLQSCSKSGGGAGEQWQ